MGGGRIKEDAWASGRLGPQAVPPAPSPPEAQRLAAGATAEESTDESAGSPPEKRVNESTRHMDLLGVPRGSVIPDK